MSFWSAFPIAFALALALMALKTDPDHDQSSFLWLAFSAALNLLVGLVLV